MSLFRKRRKTLIDEQALTGRFGRFWDSKQRQAADWLGRKTQYWNRGSWIVALVLFCLLFGCCCLLLLIHAIINI